MPETRPADPHRAATAENKPGSPPAKGMAWIPGGEFSMGSNDFYPEERPVHRVAVDWFWIDEHPVTVAEFRRFVKATGYLTWAERAPDPADYPGVDPALLIPGSLVFHRTPGPVDPTDVRHWWHWMTGAQWRHPDGPGSTLHGRERHPVTHVAYRDAEAYAAWAGKELPTEAQWEYAARGGLDSKTFCWGDEFAPRGEMMANTWQGEFPWHNQMLDGYERTSPVTRFPPNGYGLFDMAGNVWEWTSDFFAPRHASDTARPCCTPRNPRMLSPDQSYEHAAPGAHFPRRVVKGGRLTPVRAQLLPALPPRRAPRRGDRHHHRPHRVPLHRQRPAPQPRRRPPRRPCFQSPFRFWARGVTSAMRSPLVHTSEPSRRGDAPDGASEHARRHIRVQATTCAIGLQER